MKVRYHENCIYKCRYVLKNKNVTYFAVNQENMTQAEQMHSLKLKTSNKKIDYQKTCNYNCRNNKKIVQ